MTLEGLREWAFRLIQQAQAREVGCLAITDHHDLWAGLVGLETQYKTNTNVWIFPGMEVTSSEGIQGILLIDPSVFGPSTSFSLASCEAAVNQITTALGQSISAGSGSNKNLKATLFADLQKLSAVKPEERQSVFVLGGVDRVDRSFYGPDGLSQNLDRVCKDRYVLLPNLEKNKHGLFGNQAGRALYQKAEGWFLGGIVGGDNETDVDVLGGKRKADWGPRVVTCLRTSDQKGKNETEWFSDRLGAQKCASWLNLSEPTAVSVAQALISGDGRRVYLAQPQQPTERIERVMITGVDVFGSDGLDLPLVPELSAIIGGRGTGKSLVLSALMRVFGSDVDWISKVEEKRLPWERRHVALFEPGGPLHGKDVRISVQFVRESSIRYRLTLDAPGDLLLEELTLEMQSEAGWNTVAKDEAARKALDFKPLFFLQGQMSAITGSVADQEDLTKLIEGPIREHRAALRQKLEALSITVRDGLSAKRKQAELKERSVALTAQIKQKTAERGGYLEIAKKGLSDPQQRLFAESENLRRGRDSTGRLLDGISEVLEQLEHTSNDLDSLRLREKDALASLGQSESLEKGAKDHLAAVEAVAQEVAGDLKSLIKKIKKSQGTLRAGSEEFEKFIGKLIKVSSELVEREKTRKEAVRKADVLLKELAELQKQLDHAVSEFQGIVRSGKVEESEKALNTFREIIREYSQTLTERAKAITGDAQSRLIVKIVPGGRYENVIEQLQGLCQGAGVRDKTWAELGKRLSASENPASILADLVREALEAKSRTGEPVLPPEWVASGFTDRIFANVVNRTTMEDWLALSVVLAEDRVEVSYKKGGGKKPIPILNASPGERAVELLKLSLLSTTGPIVIDQPEDDLDNYFLAEQLVDLVQQAKHRNQLVFASHNANLVVHGDPEVIHVMMTTDLGGGRSGCAVQSSGTIDQTAVCESIELVMEGGQVAFERRRRKYHETLERA